ncbi:RNA polymerase sigma factor [Nannocystis punicea]|uniref:Sigma-70 family RNA polymerase sigma factor n=1 Tax=Nannocystis punicea TaxID=2995304 RepID=A0ABY7HAX9_9BACT|nr:sigma-70 family RNA polymerase sigma factor [Nannocystis poenicansa]WAS96418.1 sigma-70 family RNA polymerase sigma factor [Nannocystis poenicansa]
MDHPSSECSDDTALARACACGDASARHQAFHKFYPNLLRFFANKVRSDCVEELIHRTLLRLFERCFAEYTGQGRLISFVLGVAHRCMLEFIREGRRAELRSDPGSERADSIRPSPSQVSAQRQRHRLLREIMRTLPPELQTCLETYYWNDQTTDEVAEALGLPVGTVRARLRRGRELLKLRLAERGFDALPWFEVSSAGDGETSSVSGPARTSCIPKT